MGTKKSSRNNTAALVEGVSERMSLEETWPPEHLQDQDDSTRGYNVNDIPRESTAHPDNQRPFFNQRGEAIRGDEEVPMSRQELGLSSDGPFVAPAPVQPPESTTTPKRSKQTVASMSREAAFGTFRDKLFELCFKYGFTLASNGHVDDLFARDIIDAKGTAKRALAVGNHISGLELKP